MLGPENELPSRRAARSRGALVSQLYETDDTVMTSDPSAAAAAPSAPSGGFSPSYSEVLSLFPRPKELLSRVIQVATSSNTSKVSGARVCRAGMSAFCCLSFSFLFYCLFNLICTRSITHSKDSLQN